MDRKLSSRKGFTLVEIVTVVAIFSITMLIATNIFIVANKAQRQASVDQRIQGDVRFVMEAISREVRFGTIDYACYAQGDCDPVDPNPIDLEASLGETAILALQDVNGNKIRFSAFTESGERKLQVCFIDAAVDDPAKCALPDGPGENDWEIITPDEIRVAGATFIVFPHASPYAPCQGSCPGVYQEDAQPRVTIVLQTREAMADATPERISSQTTVVSRYYAR